MTRHKAALLCLALAAPGLAAVNECRDAAGKVRLTNKPCAPGETGSEVPLRRNPAWASDPAPPVAAKVLPSTGPVYQTDKVGAPLRFAGSELTIEANAFVETRGPEKAWRRLRPVRAASKAALRKAVEAFNAVPGLRLRLAYAETSDPAVSMNDTDADAQRGRFIAHWLEVPEKYKKQFDFSIGAFPYYRQPDGRVLVWCDRHRRHGESIGGAFIQLTELKEGENGGCGADSEATWALVYLADALGLAHTKDKTALMGGACGTQYAPADREALRKLYGEEGR